MKPAKNYSPEARAAAIEARKTPTTRTMTVKEIAKNEYRNSECKTNIYGDMTMEEINRMNAIKNLKS